MSAFRAVLLAAAASLAFACSSSTGSRAQAHYTYPGCPEQTAYCPRDKTYLCGIESIRAAHASCSADSDCTLVSPGGCITSCAREAVANSEINAFQAEVAREVDRYCGAGGCSGGSSCPQMLERAACHQGRCVSTGSDGSPDGGSPDAGNPQQSYSYPGCADAGSYQCPNSLVFVCALEAIEDKYNACQAAADCTTTELANCFAHFSCPPAAVTDAGLAAFRAEAGAEINRYCDGGTCGIAGLCAYSYSRRRVDCQGGRCVALADDAGS